MKTNWEKQKKGLLHYCSIGNGTVTVGHNDGSIESDNAGVVTFEAFLLGKYQDLLLEDFGEQVLEEVIAAVKSYDVPSATTLPT